MPINVGSVEVTVLPNARGFASDLKTKLANLPNVSLNVDANVAAARAKLDELARNQASSIRLDADTAEANAKLDDVQRRLDRIDGRDARARVSVDGAGQAMNLIQGVTAAVLAFAPAVAASAAAVAMSAPAMFAGLGLGAAGLKLGTSGISQTLTDYQAQQDGAAQAAQQNAQRIASANATVASAQASLANAERSASQQRVSAAEAVTNAEQQLGVTEQQVAQQHAQAAQQVQAAEYGLTQANQAATQAQQALNDARATAARQLQDMANQAVDARLQVQADRFALVDAQKAQQQVDASSTSTAEQRAKAALAVAQAQQRLREAEIAASRAASDNTKAQKAGVNGSQQVVAAQRNLASAHHQQQTAQQALANARQNEVQQQIAGARAIAQAEQRISDARRNEANQAANSAAAIAAAQRSLANAERQRQTAVKTTSSAAQKLAQDMADLSPAGRSFVGFLERLNPVLDHLKAKAQANLLPGLQRAITDLLPALPTFSTLIATVDRSISRFADGVAKVAASKAGLQVFKDGSVLFQDLASAALSVFDGFTTLAAGFSPIVRSLGSAVKHVAAQFDAWAQRVSTNGDLSKFLAYVEQSGPKIWQTVESLAKAVGKILLYVAPLAPRMLTLTTAMANLVASHPALVAWGIAGYSAASALGRISKGLQNVRDTWSTSKDTWTGIKDGLGTVRDDAKQVGSKLADVASAAASMVADFGKAVGRMIARGVEWAAAMIAQAVSVAAANVTTAASSAAAWVAANAAMLLAGGGIIAGLVAVGAGVYELYKHWDQVWGWIKRVADDAWHGLSDGAASLWDDMESLFADGVNKIIDGINWFIKGIDKVLGLIPGVHLHIGLIPEWQVQPAGQHHAGLRYAANGMVLPGYAPGVDSIPAMLSPGESVLRPEVTRWLGPATIDSWNHAAAHGGIPGFAFGISDIFGTIGHAVGSAVSGAENLARGFAAKGAGWAINVAETPAKAVLNHLPAGLIRTVAMGMLKALHDDIVGFIAGRGSAPGPVGASVSRWAADVARVAQMLGITTAVVPGVLSLISHESGGNPNAINLWDSNAAAGHPSQGLMQTIPATFEAYRSRALPDSITDPMANIYAGMHYALANYGLGMLMAGGRHDARGNYVGYDSGGWLPPGPSLVFNGTGSPEPVFTRHQWDQIGQAARGGDGASVAVDMQAVVDELAALRAEVRSLPKEHARIVRSR